MEIIYRNATIDDIDFLVESRLDFIHVFKKDAEYQLLKNNIQNYFETGFKEGQFNIILAEHENLVIGTGIIFYYDAVPSSFNPWGKNAYITSMFVNENYRRRGIATNILDKLIQISKPKGYHVLFFKNRKWEEAFMKSMGFMKEEKE